MVQERLAGATDVQVVREEAWARYKVREVHVVAAATAHQRQWIALCLQRLVGRVEKVVGERLVVQVEHELDVVRAADRARDADQEAALWPMARPT